MYLTAGAFCLVVLVLFLASKNQEQEVANSKQEIITATTTNTEGPRYDKTAFDDVSVTAQSFIVYDGTTGEVVAAKNATTTFPLASITKVMTAIVAGSVLDRSDSVSIIPSDLSPLGESGLRTGDVWTVKDLISYTLSVSSNDGARALARETGSRYIYGEDVTTDMQVKRFVEEMNTFVQRNNFGLLSFNNETGLDMSTSKAGAYGNATDVAKMFWYAYKNIPELFETTTESVAYISSEYGSNVAVNTNKGASHIPGLTVSKTGFTDLALGNLGVVVEVGPGRPVVIVALHSTKEGRFKDIDILRKATLKAMH